MLGDLLHVINGPKLLHLLNSAFVNNFDTTLKLSAVTVARGNHPPLTAFNLFCLT